MADLPDIFQLCVDGAAAAKLDFLLIGGHAVNARGYQRTTIDIDFLIALKLHALRSEDRVATGKDYLDILTLIRLNPVDTGSPEFNEILTRYASESIRARLLRDLTKPL